MRTFDRRSEVVLLVGLRPSPADGKADGGTWFGHFYLTDIIRGEQAEHTFLRGTLPDAAPGMLDIALHRRIFEGVFKHAGELRQYDITKKEWVLEGDTVHYLNWEDLRRALDYDIAEERNFSYKGLSQDQLISHLTRFVSGLWQIHAFGEGNTRTTAVFTILYLRHIGFKVTNDMFAQHSWYFRNALVRANYKSAVLGIDYSPVYLERFFRNLLLGDGWDLRNRYLHIHPTEEWKVQPNRSTIKENTCQGDKYPTSTRQA